MPPCPTIASTAYLSARTSPIAGIFMLRAAPRQGRRKECWEMRRGASAVALPSSPIFRGSDYARWCRDLPSAGLLFARRDANLGHMVGYRGWWAIGVIGTGLAAACGS